MVKVKKIILIAVPLMILAAGIWFFFFRQTEESIIRGRFREFSEAAAKRGKEGGIRAVATSQSLGKFFAEHTSVDVDGLSWLNGDYSPELITANAFRARQMFN